MALAALLALSGCADRGTADTTTTASPTTAAPTTGPTTSPPTTAPVASSEGLLRAACDGTLVGSSTAALADDLTSISGLAAGRRRGDVVWAVEDSFEPADLVALRADGTELGRVRVRPGALANIDWEDLAVTAAPDGSPQVWIADIGDNLTIRPTVQLYVVDEPDPADATVDARVIDVTYTDAGGAPVRPNAEAMVVADGIAWIVDKVTDGPSTIYRMVPDDADPTTATMVPAGSLDLDGEAVTALDLSADGTVLALRTSTALRLYPVAAGQDVAAALAGTPCRVSAPDEAQGESVAILPGEGGLLTVSESEVGDPVRLHRLTPG